LAETLESPTNFKQALVVWMGSNLFLLRALVGRLLHIMQLPDALKRMKRYGGSVVSLIVLFGLMAFIHWDARFRMDMASRQFAIMDDRALREMSFIDFIHGHLWIVAAYAVVFFACLVWLKFRGAPRWLVWITFLVLALPLLVYGRACLHIGNKFIMWG
jgi:hypothetical protein